ncbi:MAG TPA: response regulator [Ramlibacter sp.]|uniref:response regulator n=1 Tax=Ramlibacter sp. TaxID=1917967 RepID=UPI002D80BECF|nr:response regulator [Ramlibacter sp.]HET8748044.1 response regulator [Ramlibacter sp.]
MPPSLSTLHVLVVEDHEFQRMMLERALRSLGVEQIRSAANGAEAMRLLRAAPAVDIVITDVVMPDVDGLELIPKLRAVAGSASLVFLSSEDWTLAVGSEIAKGHGLAVLGALGKPITPQKLLPLLEAHLQLRANPGDAA